MEQTGSRNVPAEYLWWVGSKVISLILLTKRGIVEFSRWWKSITIWFLIPFTFGALYYEGLYHFSADHKNVKCLLNTWEVIYSWGNG